MSAIKAPSNLALLLELEEEAVVTSAVTATVTASTPDFKMYFCKFCKKQAIEGRFTLAQHLYECLHRDEDCAPHTAYEDKVYIREDRRRLTALKAMMRKVTLEAGKSVSKERKACPFDMSGCKGAQEGAQHMEVLHMLSMHTRVDMIRELNQEQRQQFTALYKLALPRLEYFFKLTT